jgi:hypothetical protein
MVLSQLKSRYQFRQILVGRRLFMPQFERATAKIVSKTRERLETYRGYAERSWIMR